MCLDVLVIVNLVNKIVFPAAPRKHFILATMKHLFFFHFNRIIMCWLNTCTYRSRGLRQMEKTQRANSYVAFARWSSKQFDMAPPNGASLDAAVAVPVVRSGTRPDFGVCSDVTPAASACTCLLRRLLEET